MIRIAVAEDDLDWARQLESYVARYAGENNLSLEFTHYADGEDLLEQYQGQFDIILLDIQMRFMDGMSTAELIRRTDPEVVIIFITNMAQYAIRGYEVDALDYMLKPVGYATFAQRIGRAISRIRRRERRFISIPIKGGAMKLAVEDKEAEETLEGAPFFRSNKGYLLNLDHVDGVLDNCALVAGERLLISRSRKAPFLEALAAHMGGGPR